MTCYKNKRENKIQFPTPQAYTSKLQRYTHSARPRRPLVTGQPPLSLFRDHPTCTLAVSRQFPHTYTLSVNVLSLSHRKRIPRIDCGYASVRVAISFSPSLRSRIYTHICVYPGARVFSRRFNRRVIYRRRCLAATPLIGRVYVYIYIRRRLVIIRAV